MKYQSPLYPWIVYDKPRPQAQVRLFCFPFSGGTAALYRLWPDALPQTIEVCPVQLPGRENRFSEPRFTRMDALAEKLADVLYPLLNMPFAFFGHSLGGRLAYELARTVRARHGLLPVHLFVSGCPAPHIPFPKLHIHHLSETEFVAELIRLKGTPDEVLQNQELMQFLMPILRSDFEICETYNYVEDAPLACSLTAFGGDEDEEADPAGVEAWGAYATGRFRSQIYHGGHFFLREYADAMFTTIASDLTAALT